MNLRKLVSNAPPDNYKELQKHFSDTYFKLRIGLVFFAFAIPLVLVFVGKFVYNVDFQPSMSAYFWAVSDGQCASFPMRTLFAGFLFAIGASLFMYQGLTPLENRLLNVAGLCALAVAIFPEKIGPLEVASDPRLLRMVHVCPAIGDWANLPPAGIHFPAAAGLFALLGFVSLLCAKVSLQYLPPHHPSGQDKKWLRRKYNQYKLDEKWFRRMYNFFAWAMWLFWAPALGLAYLLGKWENWVFFVEAAGVLTFGAYWLFKSCELSISRLEYEPEVAVQQAVQRRAS